MRKTSRWLVMAAALILVGCATVQDIRTANRLIHTDNELERLVTRPDDPTRRAELVALGKHALEQAELLGVDKDTQPEAVAYCRIAATAFWQSRSDLTVQDMFKAANKGKALCKEMKDPPDRDRLFLTLIIPFAALESSLDTVNTALGGVRFEPNANNITADQVTALDTSFKKLKIARNAIQEIDALENDPALTGHEEFKDYYDFNKNKAHVSFERERTTLGPLVQELERRNNNLPLEERKPASFSVADVGNLKFQ